MSSDRDVGRIIPTSKFEEAKSKLEKLVHENPEDALNYMRSDPVATIAYTRIKSNLEKSKEENVKKFFELLYKESDNIFDVEIEEKEADEIAFIVELLIERWRKEFVDNNFTSFLDFIEQMINKVASKINENDVSLGNRIAIEMLNDFHKRARSLENYQRRKFREHWEALKDEFQELVARLFNSNIEDKKISDEIQALLFLATMSPIVAKEFRSQLALLLFDNIYPKFNELQEEYKYLIAPWLKALEENAKTIKEEIEKEKMPEHNEFKSSSSNNGAENDEFFS